MKPFKFMLITLLSLVIFTASMESCNKQEDIGLKPKVDSETIIHAKARIALLNPDPDYCLYFVGDTAIVTSRGELLGTVQVDNLPKFLKEHNL